MIMKYRLLVFLGLISLALNVISYNQVECAESSYDSHPPVESFLKLATLNAAEFEYLNCSNDEMLEYVGMGQLNQQIARVIIDGESVVITEGKIDPLYKEKEEFMGYDIKILNEYCWVYVEGLTLYGRVNAVKKVISDFKSKQTLYYYFEEKDINDDVLNADYIWVLKKNYCPYTNEVKIYWAKYDEDVYHFFKIEGEDETKITEKEFERFFQVVNANSVEYQNKKIKIHANMMTDKITISVA